MYCKRVQRSPYLLMVAPLTVLSDETLGVDIRPEFKPNCEVLAGRAMLYPRSLSHVLQRIETEREYPAAGALVISHATWD